MHQRTATTLRPWSPLLLTLVLGSAYSTAEATLEGLGCREVVPSEGCVAVAVSLETYRATPQCYEEKTWSEPCEDNPASFLFTFYDYDRPESSQTGDLGIRVEWNPPSSLGKQVYLKSKLGGSYETQETTSGEVYLAIVQDASDNPGKSLSISLLDPDRECIASTTVLRVPETCYSATEDSTQESGAMLLNVTADKVVAGEGAGEMYWRVRWRWVQNQGRRNQIEKYHVRVQEDGGRGEIRWLEVRGEIEVFIGNLSSSLYTVSVWRYECGCDIRRPIGETLLDPLSEVFTTSSVALPCSTPPPPVSQLHFSPSPSSQAPPSSLHSPHLTPSTTHHPPSLTTLTTLPTSTTPNATAKTPTTINGETLAIISVTISTAIVVVIAILIVITVFLKKRKRPVKCIEQVDNNDSNLSQRPLSTVVFYSTKTPAEDIKRINELLVCGLSDYNIKVETPDTTEPREVQKEWIEKGLRESHAVLLVCNKQFEEEWKGKGDQLGELSVASVVKVMLGGLRDSDRSKIKCVYLREEDRVYSSPTLLLRHPISLADETQGLDTIARFVQNTPTYLR